MQKGKISRKGFFIGFATILVIASYSWGYQTVQYCQFRSKAKESPILWITPQTVHVTPANPAAGMKLTQGNLEFEVPWTDLDRKNETKGETLSASVFVFAHGVGISVLTGKPAGLISELEGRQAALTTRLEPVLGAKAIQSDFALTEAMLEVTPDSLKPWISRKRAVQISTLLGMKGSIVYDGRTGVFRIATQNWNGFQFDDPAQNPQHVRLELYGPQNRYLQVILAVKKDSGVRITQQDINRVLSTLKLAS